MNPFSEKTLSIAVVVVVVVYLMMQVNQVRVMLGLPEK